MTLIAFVAKLSQRRRAYVAFVAFSIVAFAFTLALCGDFGSATDTTRVIFFVACCLWVAAIVLWVFTQPWFLRNLAVPFRLEEWRGVDAFHSALERYAARAPWPTTDNLSGTVFGYRSDGHSDRARWLFYVGWAVYCMLTAAAGSYLDLKLPQAFLLTALAYVVTAINGPTYFLCFSFIWLLKDVAHADVPEQLPFLRRWPARTPELERLSAVARYNSAAFLSSTLLCSLATALHVLLAGPSPHVFSLLMVVLVAAVGIASLWVLVVMSHTFLGEVSEKWEIRATVLLERRLDDGTFDVDLGSDVSMEGAIIRKRGGLFAADLFSVSVAVASLLVDVLTLLSVLGML